jgi:glycosyltransferase involved in cell wall biosynthesis
LNVVLHRRSLDLSSGAGQIVVAQAAALEAAGAQVRLAARRGRAKFFARSGRWPRRWSERTLTMLQAQAGWRIVDHSLELPSAEVVFVHNVQTAVSRHLERADLAAWVERERRFFAMLRADAAVVANSRLVAAALTRELGVAPQRIRVLHPGYAAPRFDRASVDAWRGRARRELGIGAEVPLLGFVTSGDFQKRGLDVFLAAAEEFRRAAPAARFLVVGSKALPGWAQRSPVAAAGALLHRPKSADPRRWFAALDVFVYPARFEEFGMVVLEALACGVPVLTSRRVGAAECLPAEYEPWLLDAPDAGAFAALAAALVENADACAQLRAAGAAAAARYRLTEQAATAAAWILGSEPTAQVQADAR